MILYGRSTIFLQIYLNNPDVIVEPVVKIDMTISRNVKSINIESNLFPTKLSVDINVTIQLRLILIFLTMAALKPHTLAEPLLFMNMLNRLL